MKTALNQKRMFFFEDTGDIREVPFTNFEDMLFGRSANTMPEYAGQEKKGAIVFLASLNGRPIKIRRIDLMRIRFNQRGAIDQNYQNDQVRFIEKVVEDYHTKSDSPDILESLKPNLGILKFRNKFQWRAKPLDLSRLENLIRSQA